MVTTLCACSATYGGAILVYGRNDTKTVTNISSSLLANNSAVDGVGGALSLTGGINIINGNTFLNNTATQYGAAVAYQKQGSNLISNLGTLTVCSKGQACAMMLPCYTLNTSIDRCMQFACVGYLQGIPRLPGYLQTISQHAGNYSYLELAHNWYHNNFAENGGAVLHASDNSTTNITCKLGQASPARSSDCGNPMWTNNTVGKFGYGSLVAFPPASLQTSLPPSLLYVSNGVAKLPMSIHAVDVVGSQVTKGWLPHCSRFLLSGSYKDISCYWMNGYAAHASWLFRYISV